MTTSYACIIYCIALVRTTVFLHSRSNGQLWTAELVESESKWEEGRETLKSKALITIQTILSTELYELAE